MFDIGWTELLVIGIVALIVIGPRELPKTLRTIGQMRTKVLRMASEFQGQFNDAIREAELEEMEKKWREENARIMAQYPPDAHYPEPGPVKASEARAEVEPTLPLETPAAPDEDPLPPPERPLP